jgi:hypothetical protein
VLAVCAGLTLLLLAFGCDRSGLDSGRDAPAPPDLSSPAAAVRSYVAWVAFGYRAGNAELASATMTPDEFVRVDAYVELNRQKGRRLDERVVSMTARGASVETSRATLAFGEEWRYSYLSLTGDSTVAGPYSVSYDTTYTLVQPSPGRWLVDAVQAQPLGPVP